MNRTTPEQEQARAELDKLSDSLSFSMDFWNNRAAGHAAAVARWHLLWRQAFGSACTINDPPVIADVVSGRQFSVTH